MGQIISNHSLVFFFLILPDFWFSLEEDPKKRNIFQIMRENPEIGRKGMAIRRFGTYITDAVGKREVHIVSTVPGGLINPLTERERRELLKEAETACVKTREAFDLGKQLFEKNWPEFSKAGDYRTYYMALSKDDAVEFYDGKIRVESPSGETISEFSSQDYMANVEEKRLEWTYAKLAYLKNLGWPEGIVQVGPTARINVNKRVATPLANKEMGDFKRRYGDPAHATLLFDFSRLIDLMYACERAGELLEEETITRTDTRVKVEPKGARVLELLRRPAEFLPMNMF